ncbi:MAG: hypothetical protein EP330_11760 [Deltaproteobacteria bacterium]|nr:MAG: hypothetical protein EP330_11760 [Deltaproteobacteria bacterium]
MIWLTLLVAFAQDPDFRSHLDQAKFFAKRGWMEDAREELDKAITSEDGRVDPDVWWLLASVRLELGDLAGAEAAAEKAQTYARDEELLHAASALATFLRESFGTLRIDSDPGGLTTRLELATEASFADPAVAAYVARVVATSAEQGTRLPVDLELPVGAFAVNGIAAEVAANEVHTVTLTPAQLLAPAGSQLWRIDVALGAQSWVGVSPSLGPVAPSAALGLRRLAGPLSLAVTATWHPQPFARVDKNPVYGAASASLDASVGASLRAPFGVWTPALGYRVGSVAGAELACSSTDWSCATDGPSDLYVYAPQLVHGPVGSVWLELGDARRKSVWAPGVRAHGGLVMHSLAAAGSAQVVGGSSVDYTVESADRGGIAPTFGLSLTLSHGL